MAICCVLFFVILTRESTAMNIFKNDFEQQWEELFKDVSKLNEYTTTHPVDMRNIKISDQNIDGAIFIGAKFTGVKWNTIRGKKSKFTKTVFRDCEFIDSNFDESVFAEVDFINCTFLYSTLSGSTMTGVHFINCTMEETKLTGLDGTELLLEGDEYKVRTSFSFSGLPLKFKNANFSGVNFMGMVDSCPLTIEGGLLSEVDFGKSHFSTVTLRRVRQGEGPVRFNGTTAQSFRIEDVNMWRGLSLAEITADYVSIEGGQLKTAFSGSVISKVYARKVEFYMFSLSEANLPYVELTDCIIYDFPLWDGFTEELHLQNCIISEIDGENFKADLVIWHNVMLDGKIDFTNAQVKDFRATLLKRGPQLKLITTGSNMKF